MPELRIPVFRRERSVVARDIDVLGHVNNLVWVKWVVQLAEAHAAALGLDFETCRARGGVWVVHRQELDYHRGAVEGERLVESTWVSEMRGARSVRHARMDGTDGTLRFEARTTWAWVDARTLRARRVPAEVRTAFDLVPPEGLAP